MRKIVGFLAYHLDSLLIFLYNTVPFMLVYVLWTIPVTEVSVFFWVLCVAVCAEGKNRKRERKDLRSLKMPKFRRGISVALITDLSILGMYLAAPNIYIGWMWLGACIYIGYVFCGVVCFFSLKVAEAKALFSQGEEDEDLSDIVPQGLVVWNLCQGACHDHELRENIYEMMRSSEGQKFFLRDMREAVPAIKRSVVNEIYLCMGVPENTAEETSLTLFALRLALFSCLEAYCAGEIVSLLPGAERRLANRMYKAFASRKREKCLPK